MKGLKFPNAAGRMALFALSVLMCASIVSSAGQGKDREPAGMVLIPGGTFLMGTGDDNDTGPRHEVSISAFYMDTHEVTNAQYAAFCKDTGRRFPEFWGIEEFNSGSEFPQHPVVGVSWSDAVAYSKWAGGRLPTEAEWEYAARGGIRGKDFPNGGELDSTQANFSSRGTVPVGSYPPNGYGLYDMAGNVVEWVSDYYDEDYYENSPEKDPKGPGKGKFCVIRGGGWHSGKYCNRVAHRNALIKSWVDFNVGFRCARDAH